MNLLITGAFKYTKEQLVTIKSLDFNITIHQNERDIVTNPQQYDVVICNGLFLYNNIELFSNLKTIQLTSAGYDRIPMDYCNNHNIKVFNARGVYSIPMAEWCIMQILNIYKNASFFYENQKKCLWEKDRNLMELYKKNACIVGFGNVGQTIAKRLRAFDTTVTAVDIFDCKSQYYNEFFHLKDIKNALKKADIIILTLPLTDETRGMFGKSMFEAMKDSVILINISRGAVINKKDLIEYIKNDKFLGVSLDVFENEPLDEKNELWNLKNTIITPHNSFVGENNNERLFDVICNNLTY